MTVWDKLINRIKRIDKNLRFEELEKVLVDMDYIPTQPRSGSSHWTFRKKDHAPITIPNHQPIKIAYVKEVKVAVMQYELEKIEEERKAKEKNEEG